MPAVLPYQKTAIEQHEKNESPLKMSENPDMGAIAPFQLKTDRIDTTSSQQNHPSQEAWHVVQLKQNKIGTVPVVQLKEPWDSLAKEKWNSTIENIETYAHHIGIYDIEESDIIDYIRNIDNIEPPNGQSFKELDYGSYCNELDNVDARKAVKYAVEVHRHREWLNFEVEDSESNDDEERYYSSEEDETPGNEVEFNLIIAVIIALNKLLSDYISDLNPDKKI